MPRTHRSHFAPHHVRRKPLTLSLFFVAALTLALVLVPPGTRAAATTWHVSPGGTGACTQADPNCGGIQSAVTAASGGDTIQVAAGTYAEHVVISKDLTVNGAGAATTFVDGTRTGRVFTINSGTVSLSGMTVSNGRTPDVNHSNSNSGRGGDGGGIANGGTLNLTNITVSGNLTGNGTNGNPNTGGSGGFGGGIFNTGTLTLTNSTVSGNHTGDGSSDASGGSGGGISNTGTLSVINSIVNGNLIGGGGNSGQGGGIFNTGTLNLIGSAVSGNHAGGSSDGNGGDGGGILNRGTTTIINSVVNGNLSGRGVRNLGSGGAGGGVSNTFGATLTITNSSVNDNQTGTGENGGAGGGVANDGTLTITNTIVSGNHAGDGLSGNGGSGGGIANGGTLNLTNSTVSGNLTGASENGGGSGGGIFNGGTLNLTASTVSGNLTGDGGPGVGAGQGGGIFNQGTLTLTNGTISGNHTGIGINGGHGGAGGGISSGGGTLTVTDTTIAANSTGGTNGRGGGIFRNAGTVTVRNTIIAGNSDSGGGPDVQGSFNSEGHNLIRNTSGANISETQNAGTNITGQDPRLGPLAFYGGPTQTHLLLCGSPAIDSGDSNNAPATDQRGVARPFGAAADIGAVEMQKAQVNSQDGGAGSLRQLIQTAADGAIIDLVQCSAVTVTLTNGELLIDKNLTINGPGTTLLTVQRSAVQGTLDFRIFEVAASKRVNFSGMTIANGKTTVEGGGISNSGTLSVTGCAISNNSSGFGGGISNNNSAKVSITGSTISNNSAVQFGGGIISDSLSTVSLINSAVSGNFANEFGGGIFNLGGTVSVTGSTVSNNSVSNSGGGINNFSGSLSVINSTVSGNSANKSGGIDNDGTASVTSSTVSNNSAHVGGAVRNRNSRGGGCQLRDSIVAGNLVPANTGELSGPFTSQGHNLVGASDGTNGLTNGVNGDIVGTTSAPVDPKLFPLGYYGGPTQTHLPRPSSPALDAGDDTVLDPPLNLLTDQRGSARRVGTHVDIGAVEFNPNADTIDSAQFFVRQHYHDFLNREPDAAGLNFWVGQITACGSNSACTSDRRQNVSAAFFLSIEFQQTGYLIYKMYKVSFGNLAGAPVAVQRASWLPDTQSIGGGVVVGQTDWEQQLETNKQTFALAFVQRPAFQSAHGAQDATTYVNSLFANAGVTPTAAERSAAINAFNNAGGGSAGQAAALRSVAESGSVSATLFNEAFVLMEYFGYLQRDPNAAPDSDFAGYNFWLSKLDRFGGDFQKAEMVRAFIESTEYRQRFGQP